MTDKKPIRIYQSDDGQFYAPLEIRKGDLIELVFIALGLSLCPSMYILKIFWRARVCLSREIEGSFSLLKRGVTGTFHSISPKHLHRYLAEFEFRWNSRKDGDGERVVKAIKSARGKRLTYKDQVR